MKIKFNGHFKATIFIIASIWAYSLKTWAENADEAIAEYWATAYGGGSTGEFAPYLIGSLNHGKTPYKSTALLDAGIQRRLNLSQRFSWGFGAEGLTGYQYANEYGRWNAAEEAWTSHRVNPPAAWLQQLYAEVKWRGVFVTAGMKEYDPMLVNYQLSSGDLVFSGNTRPIPQVRAGFVDFQDIPFTNGWVQIQGEAAYGIMTDNAYMRNHYNYYNYHISENQWYVYKRCFFRSNPSQPLSITVGMQAGSFFGGKASYYKNGLLTNQKHFSSSMESFIKMFLPIGENGEEYYTGSTLGSWDLHARYRLHSGAEITGYFHWLWEDGSGIGKMNGWDGLWGIEYRAAHPGIVDGAVVEYLDFRNQSGPIHWDPDDHPGNDMPKRTTGEDNYYNQAFYNSWANYGMAIGSPYFKAPIYNLDGFPAFTCNRMYGFHLGIMGHVCPTIGYRILSSFSRGFGRYAAPYFEPRDNYSMLFESTIDAHVLLKGLSAKAQIAFDSGSLRGDNFGVLVSLTYSGLVK